MSGPRGSTTGWLAHRVVRLVTSLHGLVLRLPRRRPRRRLPGSGLDILLTGSFHSEGWLTPHLAPLAASPACARVRVVSNDPVPELERVEWVRPPSLMVNLLGRAPSRLLAFAWVALRDRPHVTGAFHLLLNGLAAVALARLVGARSLYFCVGGVAEVAEGGRHGENRLFGLVPEADPAVEQRLLRAVDAADLVVTMGTRTRQDLAARGVRAPMHVIGGGIDGARFRPAPEEAVPDFDFIFVGRLVPIKQVDLFLQALSLVDRKRRGVRAAVVGDGPLRLDLEAESARLGLEAQVQFVGRQADVGAWLRRSRVLVLTSASEGLPLSAIEAMMCGLPVVAPDVGDLPDLVTDGADGRVVGDHRPETFAAAMHGLIRDEARLREASAAAVRSAARFSVAEAVGRWNAALAELDDGLPQLPPTVGVGA